MIVAGKTILEVISMALLWQGSGIGMTSMACMAPLLIIHMDTEGVRVTLFFCIINNSLTKDFTKKRDLT